MTAPRDRCAGPASSVGLVRLTGSGGSGTPAGFYGAALWAVASIACAVSGCAAILGFDDTTLRADADAGGSDAVAPVDAGGPRT